MQILNKKEKYMHELTQQVPVFLRAWKIKV